MKTLMLLCSLFSLVPAAEWQTQVVGVKGGNSLEILRDGKVIGVKVYGIDCLSRNEALGKAARRFSAQAFMTEVSVELTGTEANGDFVAKIKLSDGRNLAAALVREGLAWWDKAGSPEAKELAMLEKDARDSFVGVWASPEDEGNDWGKEIIAARESGDKVAASALASNN
jgi:micrococcal nuclease